MKKFYFIFRQRGREEEREGEKHQCVVASHTPATWDLAHNPGEFPDWEGIEPVTLWFIGQRSVHRAPPTQGNFHF